MVTTILIQFFFSKNKISLKLKKYKKEKKTFTQSSQEKAHFGGKTVLLCAQFICIEEAHLPVMAAITAQQSRIKHSENINYKALQNNRKEEKL